MKIIILFILCVVLTAKANAHDIYNTWKNPITKESCCSNKDCQLTKAYWNGKQWVALYKGQYILIPNSLVLNTEKLKEYDGNAHLCTREVDVLGLGGDGTTTFIFCFAPPEAKF